MKRRVRKPRCCHGFFATAVIALASLLAAPVHAATYTLNVFVQNIKNPTTVNITNAQTGQLAVSPAPSVTKTSPSIRVTLPLGTYIVSASTKSTTVALTGDAAVPVYVSLAL